ncbi:MAG TPA: bifunctional DNA-formamidopyrimidine glycosylase/DNA-(apurinic or apyrimidinic site) lyase [Gemmatimonadaceae bacterium]|nr:bifunctional DNA-formamidopyrimidine glycosylase/DNA-(apurinic or apyrimidinic site) lyase [Gemmatimonadaceae bacterium]
MPELPEVEEAMLRLRAAVEGRTIARVRTHHASHQRQLPAAAARRLRQQKIVRVERRGKHQLLHLENGSTLHAHFRMNGDWMMSRTDQPLEKFTRASIDLTDGTRIELHDSRALSSMKLHGKGENPLPKLGMEANDESLDADYLRDALSKRKGPIKPALMDQAVIAGLGNIYAAEALWRAKINPRAVSSSISRARLVKLAEAIHSVLDNETRAPGRYTDTENRDRFQVYDREGMACSRCGSKIRRIPQGGRSTYFCPICQRS